jgi:hypothetical protein
MGVEPAMERARVRFEDLALVGRAQREFDQRLVERIPPAIAQRRFLPVAAGRIGVRIATDECEFAREAARLLRRGRGIETREPRQLSHAGDMTREEPRDDVDDVVAPARPLGVHRAIAGGAVVSWPWRSMIMAAPRAFTLGRCGRAPSRR